MGFAVTRVTPVAYQYGAEITFPAPEGTSNGIFAVVVQASGPSDRPDGAVRGTFHNSYIPSFIGLAVLLGGFLAFLMPIALRVPKDGPVIGGHRVGSIPDLKHN